PPCRSSKASRPSAATVRSVTSVRCSRRRRLSALRGSSSTRSTWTSRSTSPIGARAVPLFPGAARGQLFADATIQRPPIDPEDPRSHRLVAADRVEDLPDIAALDLGERDQLVGL